MAGGLMQLVAYGAQDIYLTGSAQITYFKSVYRRHTNFATESIAQVAMGASGPGKKVKINVGRNGDLINRMVLEITLPSVSQADGASLTSFMWTNDVGFHAIRSANVEIGGQEIDKHYGEWMHIWTELTTSAGVYPALSKCIGNRPKWNMDGTVAEGTWSLTSFSQDPREETVLYVPLQFWFNRNVGLSLPLIALQYHEVVLNIEYRNLHELMVFDLKDQGGASAPSPQVLCKNLTFGDVTDTILWVDYVYLDTDERRRFAQVSHEYLIEQVQVYSTDGTVGVNGEETYKANVSMKLSFNHPVKALYFFVRQTQSEVQNLYSSMSNKSSSLVDNFSTSPPGSKTPVGSVKLQLNGNDRFAARNGDYFNLVHPLFCNTRSSENVGIMEYSFALRPDEHQPNGTCNKSRIDNATLFLTGISWDLSEYSGGEVSTVGYTAVCYAVNYNVLRIMSGMGGLAYSN